MNNSIEFTSTMASIIPISEFNDYSKIVTAIDIALTILEFIVYIPTLPMTFFCSYIIFSTSILHRNLKCILLVQIFYVLLFAFTRIYCIFGQFISMNIYLVQPNWIYFSAFFVIVFGNLIGHFLIIERILATIFYKNYEFYKRWDFIIFCIISTTALSFANSYYQIVELGSLINVSTITLWTHIVAMLASFIEIFILSLITYLNVNKFKFGTNPQNVPALTVRYQLMENIRTGKQLGPTFFCHFISVSLSCLITLNCHYKWFMEINTFVLLMGIAFLIHSINNFCMSAFVIFFHPILNRNGRKLLKNLFKFILPKFNKVKPADAAGTRDLLEICPLPIDANGKIILGITTNSSPLKNQTETYFRQLYTAWGDK